MERLPLLPTALRKLACLGTAGAVLAWSGCSGVAPSKTASNAGTGAVIGGLGGAAVGSNSSMGTTTGVLGGAALGAITGGIIGMVQDAKDRKEQDKLAQERAYNQELSKKRAQEAARKASEDEELAVAQGFRISDLELAEAQKKLESATDRLKRLEAEKAAAKKKKLDLDEAKTKTLDTEAKIAQLEEELARLKGEEPTNKPAASVPGQPAPAAPASTPPPAAVKPGN